MQEMLDDHALPVEIVRSNENPPMATAASHPMVQALLAVDPATQLAGAPWFSDAAHLSIGGVPGICLGPGSIDQAHTVDEFIAVADLHHGAAFFEAFIRNLATTAVIAP